MDVIGCFPDGFLSLFAGHLLPVEPVPDVQRITVAGVLLCLEFNLVFHSMVDVGLRYGWKGLDPLEHQGQMRKVGESSVSNSKGLPVGGGSDGR